MWKFSELTKAQLHVVELMRQGWELGQRDGRCWLQQDGYGKGGKIEDVNANTIYALYNHNIIVYVNQWTTPLRIFILNTKDEVQGKEE